MPGTGLSSLSILHNVAPSTPVHNARDPHALLPGTPGSDASTTNTGGRVIAFIPPALMLKSFLKLPKAGLQGPLRQTQRSPEGPRHLHTIPRLSEQET